MNGPGYPFSLARIFHELLAATTDLAVLPGVLWCRPLRRTVQVRLGTNTLRLLGTRRKRLRCAWHAHLCGLATPIHEIFGLGLFQGDCTNLQYCLSRQFIVFTKKFFAQTLLPGINIMKNF